MIRPRSCGLRPSSAMAQMKGRQMVFWMKENSEDTSALDQPSREFLEEAIQDYNEMFHTNYDTSSEKFQNYYKDVSLRMKNKELDLLIVVNMFLTGFDATTMNNAVGG